MWHKYMTRVVVLSLAGLAGYGGWRLYDFGKLKGADELGLLRTEHAELRRHYRDLNRRYISLRERNTILESSSRIDQQAARDIQEQLAYLQEELQAAHEEVKFYRGIMAPGDVPSGLHIHQFELTPGLQSDDYHYDLVLTQMKQHDRIVTGLVEWKIIGNNGGEIRELKLSDVTRPEVAHLDFRFRYFQHLTGTISLPEGFRARTVVLSVKATGKDAVEPVQKSFEWLVTGS
ncbi:MAG: DUF6776 family protein [Gammaproteobacteria bacterium]